MSASDRSWIQWSALMPILFLCACTSGPAEVDASVVDAGTIETDAGPQAEDSGLGPKDAALTDTGTGTTAADAGPDGGDAGDQDAAAGDGDLVDGDLTDGAILADGGDAGPDLDGGGIDVGPVDLVEDFTDPEDEIFTCPDTTAVTPGFDVENGTQCLGIDGSGCPEERGLPGPGSAECSNPAQNPFIGAGQCVTDFFACFDPMGGCTSDGLGTYSWGNGAVQIIQLAGDGSLIRSEFYPSTSTVPCVVGLPETPGGSRVVYTLE